MASNETGSKRDAKLAHLPDHLVNFVDFKREMVRLDYTAENLRRACQEIEEQRRQMRAKVQRELDQVVARAHAFHQRRLHDDQQTLDLQKRARQVAERKRILQSEIQASRTMYHDLLRKQAKLEHWYNDLEEHRRFLSAIIAHRVSPRTPNSARTSTATARDGQPDNSVVQVMQNPEMIRSRQSHKERNVVAQSRMVFQACQLMERCFQSVVRPAGQRHPSLKDCSTDEDAEKQVLNFSRAKGDVSIQSALGDQIFTTIHRLHKQFISAKSSSCDALVNFADLERYAYYVLQMVDACDPAMLKKIIAKVVVDKKKTMEQEKLQRDAQHRAERERKAQANAASAPAQFKRVTVVNPHFRLRTHLGFYSLSGGNKKTNFSESKEEVEQAPTDELLYLFRLQT